MTMNNDFDGPNAPLDPDEEFKDSPGFVEAWNNSPMLKILTLGAGVVVIIGLIMMFGGGEDAEQSVLRGAQTVQEAPGAAVDPQYEEALSQADKQRLQQAMQNQGSALPTPRGQTIDENKGLGAIDAAPEEEEDPLEQWRRRAEEREKKREEARQQQQLVVSQRRENTQQQQQQEATNEDIKTMAEGMAGQMRKILEARQIKGAQMVSVTAPYDPDEVDDAPLTGRSGDSGSRNSDEFTFEKDGDEIETIIIPAGEVFYGQMVTTANSDVDGPILANIYSGPLRGARLLGRFEKTDANLLVLTFDKIVIDGYDYQIEAVAVDPETVSPGVVTDVDYHWLTRVILPGAAAFIEGMGRAYAEQENTIAVQGDTVLQTTPPLNTTGKIATGVSEMASVVGEIFEDEADKVDEPTVIVAAGTPIGILFIDALTE